MDEDDGSNRREREVDDGVMWTTCMSASRCAHALNGRREI